MSSRFHLSWRFGIVRRGPKSFSSWAEARDYGIGLLTASTGELLPGRDATVVEYDSTGAVVRSVRLSRNPKGQLDEVPA